MTSFAPITDKWLRQYIHEDDVANIVLMLSLDNKVDDRYEVYNICPAGPVVLGSDMARSMNKIAIKINPKIIQIVFSFFWHLTRGRVPTAPGVWSGYSYPIGVDGSKISKRYGYVYGWESLEALKDDNGHKAKWA